MQVVSVRLESGLISKKLNKTRISSLTMRSEEEFFSEFYYPDEMVTENTGIAEFLSISLCISEAI